MGVIVQRPRYTLLKLLTSRSPSSSCMHLEMLSTVFVSSFFRILLRLLEGYTDAEYDSCVILASCPWQEEALPISQMSNEGNTLPQNGGSSGNTMKGTSITTTNTLETLFDDKLFVGTTSDATANANLMYSIVRLRMKWENSVKHMLQTLSSILFDNGNSSFQSSNNSQIPHRASTTGCISLQY